MAFSTLRNIFFFLLSLVVLSACSSAGTAPIDNSWGNIDSTQQTHAVQPGETLYSIAWRFNVSDADLARWNNLQKPYDLRIGQVLRLTGAAPDASVVPVVSGPQVSTVPAPAVFTPTSTISAPIKTSAKTSSKTSAVKSNPPLVSKNASAATTPKEPDSLTEIPASTANSAILGHGAWNWPLKGKVIEAYGVNGNKGLDIAAPMGTPVKAVQPGTVVYAGNSLHGYGNLVIIKQKNDLMTAYAHNSKLLVKEGANVTEAQTIALSGDTEASQPMLHFEVRLSGKAVNPLNYLGKSE